MTRRCIYCTRFLGALAGALVAEALIRELGDSLDLRVPLYLP